MFQKYGLVNPRAGEKYSCVIYFVLIIRNGSGNSERYATFHNNMAGQKTNIFILSSALVSRITKCRKSNNILMDHSKWRAHFRLRRTQITSGNLNFKRSIERPTSHFHSIPQSRSVNADAFWYVRLPAYLYFLQNRLCYDFLGALRLRKSSK